MKCPVCNHENAPDDGNACPSCNSDLTAYFYVSKAKSQRKTMRLLTYLSSGLLLFAVVILIYNRPVETEPSIEKAALATVEADSPELDELRSALEKRNQDLELLRSELDALKSEQAKESATATASITQPQSESEAYHVVKAGESLWEIANNRLGDGHAYSKIAADNALKDMNHIETGDTLIIKR